MTSWPPQLPQLPDDGLPSMADLDRLSADLDRIDAVLNRLDSVGTTGPVGSDERDGGDPEARPTTGPVSSDEVQSED